MFNIMIITDSDNGISKHNKMPWYFPDDLKFFNATTINNICIMGSTTAKDLGKPLYNRDNIVISSNDECKDLGKLLPDYNYNDFIIVRNFEEALNKAKELAILDKEIFVIGGSRLFNEALQSDKLDKIYYTHINKSFDCDNFVTSILGREDMTYTILNKIKTITKNNTLVGEVELTFYLIKKKKNFL
jgi:dihydrofolate reductase